MPVLWWACSYLRQLQHEAQGHADQSGDKAGHRDSLPSIQMPELRKDILRGDPIQVSRDEDNGACCLMDKRFLAPQHTDLRRTEDHRGVLGYDKAHTQGSDG